LTLAQLPMGSACAKCGNYGQAPVDKEDAKPVKNYVKIVSARGLFDDWHERPLEFAREYFCALQVATRDQATRSDAEPPDLYVTQSVRNVVDPIWREEFGVQDCEKDGSLVFYLSASEGTNLEIRPVGKGTLAASAFATEGFNGEVHLVDSDGSATGGYLTVLVRPVSQAFYPLGWRSVEDHVSINNKKKKALGLEIDAQDGTTLYVYGVKTGIVQTNNRVSPVMLTPGQFIVNVNNIGGSAAKLQDGLKQKELELIVRRPVEFSILLEANKKADLGLEFTKKPLGNALLITKVNGEDGGNNGATSAARIWNKSNSEQQVRRGDRVIAMNGFRGKAAELLKRLNALKGPRLQLTLLRPATSDSS